MGETSEKDILASSSSALAHVAIAPPISLRSNLLSNFVLLTSSTEVMHEFRQHQSLKNLEQQLSKNNCFSHNHQAISDSALVYQSADKVNEDISATSGCCNPSVRCSKHSHRIGENINHMQSPPSNSRHFSEPSYMNKHPPYLNVSADPDPIRSHSCRTSPILLSSQQVRKNSTPSFSNSSKASFFSQSLSSSFPGASTTSSKAEVKKSNGSSQLYLIVPSNYPVIVPINNISSSSTTVGELKSPRISNGKSEMCLVPDDFLLRNRTSIDRISDEVLNRTKPLSSEPLIKYKPSSDDQFCSEDGNNDELTSDWANKKSVDSETKLSTISSRVSKANLFGNTIKTLKDFVNYDSQQPQSTGVHGGDDTMRFDISSLPNLPSLALACHVSVANDDVIRRLSANSPPNSSQLLTNRGFIINTGAASTELRRCMNTNELYVTTPNVANDSPYCSPCGIDSHSGARFQELTRPCSLSSFRDVGGKASTGCNNSPSSETVVDVDQNSSSAFFAPNESSPGRNFIGRICCDSKDLRRRVSHNEVERRRRDRINTWISELHKLLPPDQQAKTQSQSKGVVLKRVCEYFQNVHHTMTSNNLAADRLRDRNIMLEKEVRRLTRENHLLRSGLTVHFAESPPPEALISSLRLPTCQSSKNQLTSNRLVIEDNESDDESVFIQNRRPLKRPLAVSDSHDLSDVASQRKCCLSMSSTPHTSVAPYKR